MNLFPNKTSLKNVYFISIIIFNSFTFAISQELDLKFLQKEKETILPKFIYNMFKDSIIKVTTIDFTGDSIDDYIVWIQTDSLKNIDEGYVFEYFLDSNQTLWAKEVRYTAIGIFQRRFVNLDSDIELEILVLSGYADGLDNYVYDYSREEKKFKTLFWFGFEKSNSFSPLEHRYILGNNQKKKLYTKIIDMPEFESEVSIPKTQIKLPIFYFVNELNEIKNLQFFHLYSVEKIYYNIYKKKIDR